MTARHRCWADSISLHARDPRRGRARALGDSLAQPDRCERRLAGVGGTQGHPALGRVVEERQQRFEVSGDLRRRLRPPGPVAGHELLLGGLGVPAGLVVSDLGQRGLRAGLSRFSRRLIIAPRGAGGLASTSTSRHRLCRSCAQAARSSRRHLHRTGADFLVPPHISARHTRGPDRTRPVVIGSTELSGPAA